MIMFKDAAFWLNVLHHWRQGVTGTFSSRFVLPLYAISLLGFWKVLPDEEALRTSILLTGTLIIGCLVYGVYCTWNDEHIARIALQASLDKIGSDLCISLRPSTLTYKAGSRELEVGFAVMNGAEYKVLCEFVEIHLALNDFNMEAPKLPPLYLEAKGQRQMSPAFQIPDIDPSKTADIVYRVAIEYDTVEPTRRRYLEIEYGYFYDSLHPERAKRLHDPVSHKEGWV